MEDKDSRSAEMRGVNGLRERIEYDSRKERTRPIIYYFDQTPDSKPVWLETIRVCKLRSRSN